MHRKTQLKTHSLLETKLPRYTSYPTANQFNDQVGYDLMNSWLAKIEEHTPLSMYVHIPYCRELCWFCACRTQGTQRIEPLKRYVALLKKELELLSWYLRPQISIEHLHWGGGTPTILTPDLMDMLCDSITSVLPLESSGTFSVEIDPNEIDEARLDTLVKHGMNRASIGVQDFTPDIQEIIGRHQTVETTRHAVTLLRDRDIDSINVDLVYGLPGQTLTTLQYTIEQVLELQPDRIALFGYAHVPWMASRQQLIPTAQLPQTDERIQLFLLAQRMLSSAGYIAIGIDHFALPHDPLNISHRLGRLKRNFQGYSEDRAETLIGIGASSISKFEQGYCQNASSTKAYIDNINAGKLPTTRGHIFTDQDKIVAFIIESIMCYFRVDTTQVLERFDVDLSELQHWYDSACEAYPEWCQQNSKGLYIAEHGPFYARLLASFFDQYQTNQQRHSLAV